MLTERPVHADLKNMLLSNEPFAYAHLVKFERPSRPDANGQVSTSRERYSYLTDASRDVLFDDGSTSLIGTANGTQTYIANKVLKVGSVLEQTEAKANTYNLVLDGNGIGAIATGYVSINSVNPTTWDIIWPGDVDLVYEGFREGDKVTLAGVSVNIVNFRAGNVLRVSKIDQDLPLGSQSVTITLASEEIKSILLDKNVPEYASFVNREIFIYRAYFIDGDIVGAPILLFKGIISNVSFDDAEHGIEVTWGITSHWGDFQQVKGRITSDDFHRALDQNGIPQPQSALKTAYAYDKGFSHSETSLNLLVTYNVQVEKQDIKVKKGFLGIGSKVKVKKYYVTEGRNTELDFQLQAKTIPVIYGVRNTTGIPIFADTLNNDSSTVYVVYALCEGEIGGLYDVYIDGNSLICGDKGDFDARSTQTADNTVELVCRGRADKGDVLGGITSTSTAEPVNYYEDQSYLYTEFNYNYTMANYYYPYVAPEVAVTDNTGKGIVDGESINLTSPQNITLDFFSGKRGQKAASQLVEIAKAGNFKIQNAYWSGSDTAEYWGPNHRLLDTAYIVAKFKIEEGETTIPNLEFIIRGKNIDCYNYDYSYSHYTKASEESADNFKLGDFVTLYDSSNNAISGTVQIIDKWTFANPDGTLNTRFRWSLPPNLQVTEGVPAKTKFYMKNSSNQTWTMVTWNYIEFNGTVPDEISRAISSAQNKAGKLEFTMTSPLSLAGGDPAEPGPYTSVYLETGDLYLEGDQFNSNRILTGETIGTSYETQLPYEENIAAEAEKAIIDGGQIVSRNTIKLPSNASSVSNYYKNYLITISRYNGITNKQVIQERKIISYDGNSKVATIDDVWDADMYPKTGDSLTIVPPYTDKRVSINAAMQTMDYMTSATYGRGLDAVKDLRLSTWLESGRKCDERSTVTMVKSSGSLPSIGHVYRWPQSGDLVWQGTVSGIDSELGLIEFDNVIGKIAHQWNNWRSWNTNELVWREADLYRVVSSGTKAETPVHQSGIVAGLEFIEPLPLTSSNGGPAIQVESDGNPAKSIKNGVYISGYSLYDCDEINYWRYLGWDEFDQRYVTRHQTNLSIDTSLPLFDNINSLLEHYGGILSYNSGKWDLAVEDYENPISEADSEVRNITADHIIGKIRLSDDGTRSSYNSLTAAFADPGAKFESKNISFFNSEFLKSDRNAPKKGNLSIPGITNYYNCRILADKYLNKSRYGLTVSFNMSPRGILLLSGSVIQLPNSRYGWTNKKFRISSLTHLEDCTVDVVAEEYDDSFYTISNLSRQAGSGVGGTGFSTTINSPTNLRATSIDSDDENYSSVEITWDNNPTANTRNVYTELYSSPVNDLFIQVNSINSNIITIAEPHGLEIGNTVISRSSGYGLVKDKRYYVIEVPSDTTIKISESKNGPIHSLTNVSDIVINLMTATLIATLPIPINSFLDVFGSAEGRVIRYYWARHKIVKE